MRSIKYPHNDLKDYAGFSSHHYPYSAFYHSNILTKQPIQLSNKYKWSTREFNYNKLAVLNKIKAKNESLLAKQTIAKNTQPSITEAQEYSMKKRSASFSQTR